MTNGRTDFAIWLDPKFTSLGARILGVEKRGDQGMSWDVPFSWKVLQLEQRRPVEATRVPIPVGQRALPTPTLAITTIRFASSRMVPLWDSSSLQKASAKEVPPLRMFSPEPIIPPSRRIWEDLPKSILDRISFAHRADYPMECRANSSQCRPYKQRRCRRKNYWRGLKRRTFSPRLQKKRSLRKSNSQLSKRQF